MTTTQFARIPQFKSPSRHHQQQSPSECSIVGEVVADATSSRTTWDHTLPINRIILDPDFVENEYVIANGHPISPVSTFPMKFCSEMNMDEPDCHQGINRTYSYDPTLFDIRKVTPEQIAAQITLLDQDKFKAIRIEEFSNCNWTKKEKQILAPHIVAFTQQFNHIAFLVMREILNQENEKARADVISQFIKIAKKLYDMNNIHSLKAVVSALQSTPIHRLSQTWRHLTKKDRSNFEKLEDFLSDRDNWKVLREHMDGAKLPCIPHLGLYLTDLCFLHDVPNKELQTESIVNLIAYFQNSDYGEMYNIEPHVQRYLTQARYIDELQKFYEEENYKLSLKYEPHLTPKSHTPNVILRNSSATLNQKLSNNKLRLSKSLEDLLQISLEERSVSEDPESPFSVNCRSSCTRRSLNSYSKRKIGSSPLKLKDPGHSNLFYKYSIPSLVLPSKKDGFTLPLDVKKSVAISNRSKGGSLTPFSSPFSFNKSKSQSPSECMAGEKSVTNVPSTLFTPPALPHPFPFPVSSSSAHTAPQVVPPSPLLSSCIRGHKKSHSLGSNVLAKFGVARFSPPVLRKESSPDLNSTSLSLLDDSLLDTFPVTPTDSTGNASISGGSSYTSLDDLYRHLGDMEDEDLSGYLRGADFVKDGVLKRKTLKNNGNPVSQLRRHVKCLVQLTSDTLYFTDVKHSKKQNKRVRSVLLCACQLKHRDPSEKITEEQFIISDDYGNSTRFTAKSASATMEWVVAIKEAIRVQEEKAREETERSLIKL